MRTCVQPDVLYTKRRSYPSLRGRDRTLFYIDSCHRMRFGPGEKRMRSIARHRVIRLVLPIPYLLYIVVLANAAGDHEPEPPLSAGTFWATKSAYEVATGKRLSISQAPILDQMVSNDELPPLDQRIVDDPLVVRPFEGIGQYGGTLELVMQPSHFWPFGSYFAPETVLGRGRPVDSDLIPNIASDWKYSDDYTELTLHLRTNHKWSTQHAFTADDFVFWYNDLVKNTEYTPKIPSYFENLNAVEVVDDTTVKFKFTDSSPEFVNILSDATTGVTPYAPSEYLKSFHPAYAPNANNDAKERGFSNWSEYLRHHARYGTKELPRLSAWVPKTIQDSFVVQTRNPYYYKIDTAGNQLPYIDQVTTHLIPSSELASLKVISGESDYGAGTFGGSVGINVLPQLYSSAERNNLRVSWTQVESSPCSGQLGLLFLIDNWSPKYLPRESNFRLALSQALDRDYLNDQLFFGLGSPIAPDDTDQQHYSPDQAKALLEGFNVAGLSIVLTVATDLPIHRQSAHLISEYWQAVGLTTTVQHNLSTDSMVLMWELDGCEPSRIDSATPYDHGWPLSGQFWSHVKRAEDIGSAFDVPSDILQLIDSSAQASFWYISVLRLPPDVRYARDTLRNIDLENLPANQFATSAAYQWYLDR